MPAQLLGVAEIAAMLGLTRQRVNQIIQSDGFPAPVAELSAGRIWSRAAVEAWVAAHPNRYADPGAAIFGNFTGDARSVIVRAQEEARGLRHAYTGTEHLLLAVLADEAVRRELASLGVDADTIATDVEATVPQGDVALVGHIPYTPRSKDIIAAAASLAAGAHCSSGASWANSSTPAEPRHLMRAIARCADGIAAALLRQRTGLGQDELVAELDRRLSSPNVAAGAPDGKAAACSFCDQTQDQVVELIPGPGVAICDQCVARCSEALGRPSPAPDKAQLQARMDALADQLDQLRRDLG